MKPPDKERTFLTVAVIGLAAILVLLGILQYRWSGEISQAASDRLRANLQKSMSEFRDRLTHDVTDVCVSLQPDAEVLSDSGTAQYARRFLQWQRASANGRLVKNIYMAEQRSPGTPLQLLRLNPEAAKFEAVDWPADFADLQQMMERVSPALPFLHPGMQAHGGPHPGGPPEETWVLNQAIPALVRPFGDQPAGSYDRPPAPHWLIVQLDSTVLEKQILPELARAQFAVSGQFDFKVAVLDGTEAEPTVVYASEPGFGVNPQQPFAGRMKLWGPPRPPDRPGPPQPRRDAPREPMRAGEPHEPVHLFVVHDSPGDREWELVVDPRSGSLEASVAGLRRRNLAVSFGILLILAGTIAAVMLTTARARRVAALQMEFVTGVTHELRTPLAVILSASENIKDGVVNKPSQLARYGDMIHRQTKQLMQLVEQVLLFASARNAQLKVDFRAVDVVPVVESASDTAKDSGFTVERQSDLNLPLVMADPGALLQCLQNIVSNAVKYGGAERWIGVEVRTHNEDGRSQVAITIRDRGIGMHRSESTHIFEPFYRSPAVAASNVHGTGLGLSLTKTMIEAMHGRITVESQPGQGSTFTVYLPVAANAQADTDPREDSDTHNHHV